MSTIGEHTTRVATIVRPMREQSPFQRFLSDFFESKVAAAAVAAFAVILFIAIFAPWISPQDPYDLLLPALNLALFKISLVIRLARAGTREVALQDYIKFARAKGLSSSRVVLVHVMKNIMIPVVTVLGLELGGVIAFAVVTETVFAWPGMGKLLIDSIQLLDRPVVVAYLMITVLMFIAINLVVDILYSILDPRVRLKDVES